MFADDTSLLKGLWSGAQVCQERIAWFSDFIQKLRKFQRCENWNPTWLKASDATTGTAAPVLAALAATDRSEGEEEGE